MLVLKHWLMDGWYYQSILFSLRHRWPSLILVIFFMPFGFLAPKDYEIYISKKFLLWEYLMKVTPETRRTHVLPHWNPGSASLEASTLTITPLNKMKSKKYNTVRTIRKSNRKIVERDKIDSPDAQLHVRSLSWIGTGISLKEMSWLN